MSRLVDTHILIAHWGFPSFHLGHWHDWLDWSIILIGDSDTVIFFVLHWYIRLRHWHAGLLMIDLIALLSTLTLILSWLFWSLHMHTLTTVHHSTRHADPLVGILFDHLWACYLGITIHLIVVFSLILCVYIDDISEICLIECCMTALLLLDCMSLVYVGRIYIPLPPTLLVSVIPFIPILTIASMRPSVCLLSDRARD